MCSIRPMTMAPYLELLALSGVSLSGYACLVTRRMAFAASMGKAYRPSCDLAASVSCSRAFTSPHASIFGIPNCAVGVAYYLAVLGLAHLGLGTPLLALAGVGLIPTLYLAYISSFRLKNFCLVCGAIYIINVAIAALLLRGLS